MVGIGAFLGGFAALRELFIQSLMAQQVRELQIAATISPSSGPSGVSPTRCCPRSDCDLDHYFPQ